jgi:hypothetical protein
LSRRSSGSERRPSGERFKPKQLKRILSGAFSAGPTARFHGEEKRA